MHFFSNHRFYTQQFSGNLAYDSTEYGLFHEEITDQFIVVNVLKKCVCVAEYF
jgi:hypothetical protein